MFQYIILHVHLFWCRGEGIFYLPVPGLLFFMFIFFCPYTGKYWLFFKVLANICPVHGSAASQLSFLR